jgi:hypothetical protein
MSKFAVGQRPQTGKPKPPAGPGDLSKETPQPPPVRKDVPAAPPPAGPGKFPDSDAVITPATNTRPLMPDITTSVTSRSVPLAVPLLMPATDFVDRDLPDPLRGARG